MFDRRPRLPVLLAGVLAAGCEHGIVLRGTVTVPAAVQARSNSRAPAVVVIRASIPKTSGFSYRLGVLCGASDTPLVLPLLHDGFGCAKEGVVEALLVTAPEGEQLPCGTAQAPWSGSTTEVLAAGSEVVFAGQTGGFGCSSGEDEVSIVLEPQR